MKRNGDGMSKKKDNHFSLFNYNIDFDTRTLYYGSSSGLALNEMDSMEVNDWSSEQLIKGLFLLEQRNKKPITIIWNSNGGEWDAGIAIFEYIRTMKSKITMISYSRCRSMGSIIMQACHKRILSKNSRFMIHYGTEGIDSVHSKDFEKAAEESKKSTDFMEQTYLTSIKKKKPRFTLEKLKEMMKYDCYMSAKEAVDLGLADKVI